MLQGVKLAVSNMDPANEKETGKDKDALHHHLAESPLKKMASERGRVLQERQTNHFVSSSKQAKCVREKTCEYWHLSGVRLRPVRHLEQKEQFPFTPQ